jgi:hypothetical protein
MMPATPTPTTPTPTRQQRWKQRLLALYEEYGTIALVIFVVIWLVTLGSLWTAVKMGWRPESAAGEAGTFGAAYIAFRITLPLRIGATMVLTPLAARALVWLRLRSPKASPKT